jgi:hypothetical protein
MDYRTVFDVTEAGFKSWSFPASGLIFVAIGTVLVAIRSRLNKQKWSPFLFLGFAVAWTTATGFSTYSDYRNVREVTDGGKASVVEGPVSTFVPMPKSGHSMERFCVSEVCFAYSDFVISSGFNNTSSHGGPIREGLPVRVTYVGNTIVKLEVAR